MSDRQVALYARVSTEQQARDNTIASQVAALRERIAADGYQIEPDHAYVDEGYSGWILLRPALEQPRDAVAAGQIERVYVLAPDRLARRYAHQVLVMEEFRRAGVEIEFLNRPISGTAEDDLLLQIQGVVAEYERARILERSRRGAVTRRGPACSARSPRHPLATATLRSIREAVWHASRSCQKRPGWYVSSSLGSGWSD